MSKYMQFAKCLRNANAPLVLSIGAVLLLALAALVGARGSTQAQSLDMETAKYEITFTGLFDGDALSAGTAVPANAGFSVMVGGAHNSSVTYWSAGAAASSGLERLAEDGATTDFREEINASVNAGNGKGSFVYTGTDLPPTGDRAILFKTTRDFPLVTLAAKVEPSPDWFVGVSGLDLRPNGEWEREVSVDLYPWDAGTEGGSQFSDGFPATNPQGRISSLRNTERFSDGPIARVTFTLREPPKVKGVGANPGDGWVDVSWNEIDVATGYKVQWKSGNQGFGNAASDGREALVEDGKTVRHAILGLTNGTEYTVRVIATNPMGEGRPSEQVTETPVEGTGEDILVSNVGQNAALTAPLTISACHPPISPGLQDRGTARSPGRGHPARSQQCGKRLRNQRKPVFGKARSAWNPPESAGSSSGVVNGRRRGVRGSVGHGGQPGSQHDVYPPDRPRRRIAEPVLHQVGR